MPPDARQPGCLRRICALSAAHGRACRSVAICASMRALAMPVHAVSLCAMRRRRLHKRPVRAAAGYGGRRSVRVCAKVCAGGRMSCLMPRTARARRAPVCRIVRHVVPCSTDYELTAVALTHVCCAMRRRALLALCAATCYPRYAPPCIARTMRCRALSSRALPTRYAAVRYPHCPYRLFALRR